MMRYITTRITQALFILFGVSFITFLLLYILPADPAVQIAGRSATPETVASIRAQLGLDQPLFVQYFNYMTNLLQGDFGRSYLQKSEVSELIASRLGPSLSLMFFAIAIELLIGLLAGIIAAMNRGKALDKTLMVLSFIAVSAPQFIVSILILYVFAVKLGWFPIGGYGDPIHYVLPALTLGLLGSGWYSRVMRSSMLDVLRQDYIRTARAKGLTERTVIMRHAFRNTMIPLTTIMVGDIAGIVGGAIITERVFGWQGMGTLFNKAINSFDLNLLMGVILFLSTLAILANLVADLLYSVLDPRIRVGAGK